MHAISRDADFYKRACIYCQLDELEDLADADQDEFIVSHEIMLVPEDEMQGVVCHSVAAILHLPWTYVQSSSDGLYASAFGSAFVCTSHLHLPQLAVSLPIQPNRQCVQICSPPAYVSGCAITWGLKQIHAMLTWFNPA
jgi:hypothetical protein